MGAVILALLVLCVLAWKVSDALADAWMAPAPEAEPIAPPRHSGSPGPGSRPGAPQAPTTPTTGTGAPRPGAFRSGAAAQPPREAPAGVRGGGDGDPRESGPSSRSARYTVRWEKPGLCADEEGSRRLEARPALLATFEQVRLEDVLIAHDRSVPPAAVQHAAHALRRTRMFVTRLLGWAPQPFPPPVFLYRDPAQMLSVSCSDNKVALGYYDGAIHVSASPALDLRQVQQSVAHEYTHHFLNSLGVPRPMWLHEGLAMTLAEEDWWDSPQLYLKDWLLREHLDFEGLAEAFPHGADETFALAVYFQSHMMVAFIRERRGPGFLAELVDGLATGRISPGESFAVAAGLQGRELEDAWGEFVRARLQVRGERPH